MHTQQRIHRMIAEHQPLADVLGEIARFAEQMLPRALVSLMQYDPQSHTIGLVPGGRFSERFTQAMQGVPVAPDVGACGSAAWYRELVVTEDIGADPRWEGFRDVALAEGLQACWSVPIMSASDGELLGTFATYYRQAVSPSSADLFNLQQAAALAALAIVRNRDWHRYQDLTARYQSLYEHHPDGVYEFDLDGYLRRGNAAFARITGYSKAEYAGHHFNEFVAEPFQKKTREAFAQARSGGHVTYQTRGVFSTGEPYDLEVTNFPIQVEGEIVGVFGVCRDISLRKEHERLIAFHNSYDAVTGLVNRVVFEEQLLHALHERRREGRAVAVMYLDLDGFKPINEGFGHRVGNTLLQRVAERLQKLLGEDCVLSRLVADEFVVLLPEVEEPAMVERRAEAILSALEDPFEVEGHAMHLSASAGLAMDDGESEAPILIQHADIAMEVAKSRGMNTWHWYEQERRPATQDEIILRHDLRLAMERNELELHYQPVIDAVSGSWRGVEALVRWHHPQRGMISPGVFIPLAEQTGQIIEVGRWVLRRACEDGMQRWREGHRVVPVAVNISTLQFRRRNFVEEVRAILAETGLPGHLLELEVTEGVLMENAQETIELMKQLRELGVTVSIDDFGTGYSSLRYLRDLPASKVKLDISFIRDILTNPDNMAIVQGIITMAHHMQLKVVAEGVETEAQRDDLIARGCDLLQGFLFSRALPVAELASLPTRFPDRS
ncbi:bifunctional diguanylate cyclase/phosphodiesterase [Halovibrio salipaludis]|uniref:cyclic-guanylate-specific phosphodiesterase n=1 Tax=Halovibrio salipaludis TaxID=2032626 RepID=A0A2A2F2D5_9GAMM|nr:bifunctional diguanylate cyclase/phosphodiesterase [Halovibrio salipaludis]